MDTPTKNTFGKDERLCGEKRIESLFKSGSSFIAYPIRIVFLKRDKSQSPDVSIMVSVSKKKFKRAVKRNRMKRLVREAYRLNKSGFYAICNEYGTAIDIAFLYLKDKLADFQEIQNAMLKAVNMLEEKIKKDNNNA